MLYDSVVMPREDYQYDVCAGSLMIIIEVLCCGSGGVAGLEDDCEARFHHHGRCVVLLA